MECLTQELIPWGGKEFTDAFTLLRRPRAGELLREPIVAEHQAFLAETGNLLRVKRLYADREASEQAAAIGSARAVPSVQGSSPLPLRYQVVDLLHSRLNGGLRRVPVIRRALEQWLSRRSA